MYLNKIMYFGNEHDSERKYKNEKITLLSKLSILHSIYLWKQTLFYVVYSDLQNALILSIISLNILRYFCPTTDTKKSNLLMY